MSAFKRKAQQQKLRYALALLDDNTPDAEEELLTLIKEAKPEFDNEREVAKAEAEVLSEQHPKKKAKKSVQSVPSNEKAKKKSQKP